MLIYEKTLEFKVPNDAFIRQPPWLSDIYALVLIGILILCLFVVAGTYILLYITVRRASCFRQNSTRSSKNSCNSVAVPGRSDAPLTPTVHHHRLNVTDSQRRVSIMSPETHKRGLQHPTIRRSGERSLDLQPPPSTHRRNHHNSIVELSNEPSSCLINDRITSMSNFGSTITTTMRLGSTPMTMHRRPRRDSRLLKRHKCIIVILTVCCMYLVYLSCYFGLQIFHAINIAPGLQEHHLRNRYTIQLILRYMFVLQASLNPLVFFRIKTFRVSVQRVFKALRKCCGGGARRTASFNQSKFSRPSMTDCAMQCDG